MPVEPFGRSRLLLFLGLSVSAAVTIVKTRVSCTFEGSNFWTLDKTFRADAVRKTSDLAVGLDHIDAAYFKPPNLFLFSGDSYYKYIVSGNEMSLANGNYPKLISQGYPGMADAPVDEIIRRGSQLWFFHSGANVTVYNPEKFPPIDAASGYLTVSDLEGFPDRVTAAFVDENDPKGSFVFTDGAAFKLSQTSSERLRTRGRHFPRTFREWLRCTSFKN